MSINNRTQRGAIITVTKNNIIVQTSYNAAWIADVKQIPPEQRAWNATQKAWTFTPKMDIYEAILDITRRHFGEPLVLTPEGSVADVLSAAIDTTSYYTILGIESTASAEEIKRAYRRLVSKHHPDRHQGSRYVKLQDDLFIQITKAYQTLKDPLKRKRYDIAYELVTKPEARRSDSAYLPI